MEDQSSVEQQPYFMQRLDIEAGADERTIKRAYARALKLIDLETDPAGFQELREAYDAALFWMRHGAAAQPDDGATEQVPARAETEPHQPAEPALADAPRRDAHPPQDEASLALDVFAQFQQRCACADDLHELEAWKRELNVSIADDRLVNIAAREAFEQQVANLLASGWRPGHHVLLVAALEVFEWDQDRRRLHALGGAGYTLDCAIDQRTVYDLQSDDDCELQRAVIVRLRDLTVPSNGELIQMMPVLAVVTARFPTWLALIVDTDRVELWQRLDKQVPQWRRWLKHGPRMPRLSIGPWSIIIAFSFLMLLFTQLPDKRVAAPTLAEQQIEQASGLLDSGDDKGALAIYDRVIQADSRNADAYAGRAMTLIGLDDDKNAALALDKLEMMDNTHAVLYRGRGVLAYNQGRYPDAIAAFTRSLERDSGSEYTRMWRARSYLRLKNYDKAVADADALLSANPAHVNARLIRARVFKLRNDKAAELAEAKAVLVVNANNAYAYIAAARMYNDVGDDAQALLTVNRGIAKVPGEDIYMYRLLFRDAKDFAGRREDLIGALKSNPSSSTALFARVDLELEAEQYNDVIAAVDHASRIELTSGQRLRLLAMRAIALTKLGKHVEADREFALAKAAATTATHLNNLCWDVGLQNVALQTALSFCDASLAQDAESANAFDSKGFVLLRLKRFKESISSYDTALKLREGGAWSLYGRGIAKRRIGKVKEGDADIKAALQAEPGVGEVFTRAGVAR